MTIENVQKLQKQIESAKTNKARAEGSKERLEQQLKTKYKIGFDEIDSRIKTEERDLAKLDKEENALQLKLDVLCDWDNL